MVNSKLKMQNAKLAGNAGTPPFFNF